MNPGIRVIPDIARAKYGLRSGIWASEIVKNALRHAMPAVQVQNFHIPTGFVKEPNKS